MSEVKSHLNTLTHWTVPMHILVSHRYLYYHRKTETKTPQSQLSILILTLRPCVDTCTYKIWSESSHTKSVFDTVDQGQPQTFRECEEQKQGSQRVILAFTKMEHFTSTRTLSLCQVWDTGAQTLMKLWRVHWLNFFFCYCRASVDNKWLVKSLAPVSPFLSALSRCAYMTHRVLRWALQKKKIQFLKSSLEISTSNILLNICHC